MESTGKYWVPVWNVLEGIVNVVIANPKWVSAVKGNKDDKKDSKWIGDLFRMGLPSGQAGSVGTDPLEKYFAMEAELHVSDVMNPDIALFQKETSLSDVVCELSMKKSGQVYITDKHQELRGIIDRTILLERIHNL